MGHRTSSAVFILLNVADPTRDYPGGGMLAQNPSVAYRKPQTGRRGRIKENITSREVTPPSRLDLPCLPKSIQNAPSQKGTGDLKADIRLVSRQKTQRGPSFRCHCRVLYSFGVCVRRGAAVLTGPRCAGNVEKPRGMETNSLTMRSSRLLLPHPPPVWC